MQDLTLGRTGIRVSAVAAVMVGCKSRAEIEAAPHRRAVRLLNDRKPGRGAALQPIVAGRAQGLKNA